jgi:hypothetical protein
MYLVRYYIWSTLIQYSQYAIAITNLFVMASISSSVAVNGYSWVRLLYSCISWRHKDWCTAAKTNFLRLSQVPTVPRESLLVQQMEAGRLRLLDCTSHGLLVPGTEDATSDSPYKQSRKDAHAGHSVWKLPPVIQSEEDGSKSSLGGSEHCVASCSATFGHEPRSSPG